MALSSRPEVPAFDASDLKELKRTLVTACRVLDREGITDGYGHVSARVPGADAFLTIANVSPGLATVERLIMMDLDGKYLGGAETPPNEWPIHACVFKVRPDVMSIAHTHSIWSSLFSVLPIKLRPLHHYGKFLSVNGPPIYQGAGLVRTVERGYALAKALGDEPVVLMRAHGDTVVGASIEQVVQRTVRLAKLGELTHLALLHGEPRYLTAEELETFNADERFPARGWEYYISRLGKRES